jgi:hypothetical protein
VLNSVCFLVLAVETSRPTPFQWSNVEDGNGIAIAITGMLIVSVALILISGAIAALPHILAVLDPYLPAAEHHHAPTPTERLPADEEKIVAAIGMVLHSEIQKASQ